MGWTDGRITAKDEMFEINEMFFIDTCCVCRCPNMGLEYREH